MKRITFGLLWLMALTIPFERMIVITGVITLTRALNFFAVVAWLITVTIHGTTRRLTGVHGWMFAWVGLSLGSYFWSSAPGTTISYTLKIAGLILSCMALYDLTRSERQLNHLLRAYVVGAYVSVLGTIIAFAIGQQAAWNRYGLAGYSDTNVVGMLIALAIPIAWYLLTKSPHRWERILGLLFIPLSLLAVILTGSRTSTVLAVLGILYVLGIVTLRKRKAAVGIVLVLAMAGVVAAQFVPEVIWTRLASTKELTVSGDFNDRGEIWLQGLEAFGRAPLVGHGGGAFHSATEDIMAPLFGRAKGAHSIFVASLVEVGLVGFLILAGLLTSLSYLAWRHRQRSEWLWLVILLVTLIGTSMENFQEHAHTWLMFGFIMTQAYLRPADEPGQAERMTA